MYNKSGPVKNMTKQLTAKEVPQNEETVSQSPKDVPSKSSKDVITKEQQSTQQRHQSSNHRGSDVKTDWKEVKSKKYKSRGKPLNDSEGIKINKPSNDELAFQFDEDLDSNHLIGRKNQFTSWSDDDSDYEISDNEVAKIIIVTQSLLTSRVKHEGYDRTGDWMTRVKLTQELEKIINDGLFYYEQDLWTKLGDKQESKPHKTVDIISQEAFEKYAPKSSQRPKAYPPPPPPPPPPTFEEDSYLERHASGIFFHFHSCESWL
jgi:la-related protein 1